MRTAEMSPQMDTANGGRAQVPKVPVDLLGQAAQASVDEGEGEMIVIGICIGAVISSCVWHIILQRQNRRVIKGYAVWKAAYDNRTAAYQKESDLNQRWLLDAVEAKKRLCPACKEIILPGRVERGFDRDKYIQ